jgi:hypothetical protein
MKRILLAAIAALVLVAPASASTKHHPNRVATAEVPADQALTEGYRRASGFEQVKAQCELIANGLAPSGGFVMGSPEFVAGASIGHGIGMLIRHAQDYSNCMTLNGYTHN